jgi:asparagine synthase (glutamine-hydrolysing)
MSGIAGCVSRGETRSSPTPLLAEVEVLLDALKHRGRRIPGVWQGPGCALGATLTATTPEALTEEQPLVDRVSGRVLVWDGRLDNRDELLALLAHPGERPTDAELALRAFNRWEKNCAQRLIGDFAFAVWDPRSQTLSAARDPLGLRPFFYSADAVRFYFASEIQALLRLPAVPREIDEWMVSEYLVWWTDFPQPERTFFRSVQRLLPAHWLRWTPKGLESHRYWEIDPERHLCDGRKDYLEQFASLLSQAVASRMRTPTRIGVFLSGGLDSASVASLASRHNSSADPMRGYCLQLLDHRDESPLAEQVAQRAGIEFQRVPYFAESFLDGLETHIERLAMPFVEEGWVHERNLLARVAEDRCNVILTGDGGDELFSFAWGYVADLLRSFRMRALVGDLGRYARYFGSSRSQMMWHAVPFLMPRSLLKAWKHLRWRKPPAWINSELARRTNLIQRLRQIRSQRSFHSLSAQMDHHILTRGRMILVHERRELAAAQLGIELRFPFLDRRLLEFMLAVPWEEKVKEGRVKPFLRDMPDVLPDAIRNLREKANYGEVNEFLMRRGDHAALDELFLRPPAEAGRYVNLQKAKKACRAFLAGDNAQQRPTWVFACLYLWLKNAGSRLEGPA